MSRPKRSPNRNIRITPKGYELLRLKYYPASTSTPSTERGHMNELASKLSLDGLKKFRLNALYRCVNYVDEQAGDILEMSPVLEDGFTFDDARQVRYFSSITMNFGGAPQLVKFEIKGVRTLKDAVTGWPDAAKEAAEGVMRQMQEQSKHIVLPPTASARLDS